MKRRGVRRWLRLPVTQRVKTEADVEVELTSHIEERVERLVAAGMSEEAARSEAERRLGGMVHARNALVRAAWDRDVRLSMNERARSWGEDARYALRSVFRERGYATVVILTLALGIGANATMFGVLDRLLLSGPAHVVEPHALYRFYVNSRSETAAEVVTYARVSYPVMEAYRASVGSLEHISGYMDVLRTLGSGPEARRLKLLAVSSSYFDMTGTRPELGRWFDEAEDAPPSGQRVIVLSHRLWQGDYGGRRDVLGETMELSGSSYTIIGVAPPGFTGVGLEPRDGWIPLADAAALWGGPDWATNTRNFYMGVVGRLRPGATPERAAAEATAAWRAVYEDSRRESQREARITLAPISAGDSGEETMDVRVARWLVAVSAIVLLVACANVANLYLARGLRRRREVAVRLALGISRGRLLRLLLTESMLLALLGGAAALLVAYWGASFVRLSLLPEVDWIVSPLSPRVLGFAAALTAFVGVVTGLVPALQATNSRLAPALSGSVHAPPAPGRSRSLLAVVQAAFCVVLLVGAGLFVRSLWTLQSLDLGVDDDRVLGVRLEWQTPPDLTPAQREELGARRQAFVQDALDRLAGVPGVERTSAGVGTVFFSAIGGSFRPEGMDSIPRMPGGGPYMSAVTSDYFATLGTPLLRGRTFVRGEGAGTEPVVIVSRTTAETLWPESDPIGRCVYGNSEDPPPCARVVGVVGDVRRFNIDERIALQFYVPLGQQAGWMTETALLARSERRAADLAEPIRQVLHGMDPSLRYAHIVPFTEYLAPQRRPWTLGAALFVICGILALLIAVIGLYSVIAYLVLHRTHEIGVRMALGAERGNIVAMILRHALGLAGVGIALGSAIAFLAAPALQPLLFETQARDYAVLASVAATLAAAAIAAGVLPALRASRVTPMQALRDS